VRNSDLNLVLDMNIGGDFKSALEALVVEEALEAEDEALGCRHQLRVARRVHFDLAAAALVALGVLQRHRREVRLQQLGHARLVVLPVGDGQADGRRALRLLVLEAAPVATVRLHLITTKNLEKIIKLVRFLEGK
jgi:hypothetical protein